MNPPQRIGAFRPIVPAAPSSAVARVTSGGGGGNFHPEYLAMVNRFPSSQTWFKILTEMVPARVASAGSKFVEQSLVLAMCDLSAGRLSPFDFRKATIYFGSNPQIAAIAGKDLEIPHIIFQSRADFGEFVSKLGGEDPIATILQMKAPEFLRRLALRNVIGEASVAIDVVIACSEQLVGLSELLTPDSELLHQETLAIDPFSSMRQGETESRLLAEIAATLGEYSYGEFDGHTVASFPEIWSMTLSMLPGLSPELLRFLGMGQIRPGEDAALWLRLAGERMADRIRVISQKQNSQAARMILSYMSFKELLLAHPELAYKDPTAVPIGAAADYLNMLSGYAPEKPER